MIMNLAIVLLVIINITLQWIIYDYWKNRW